MTFLSFLVLVVSGIYLALFYRPVPAEAHLSVATIVEDAPWGATLRGIHSWTASIFVAGLALHVIRVFLYASYKRPREINWVVGVLLLAVGGIVLYTGTILKWDQEGFEALQHTVEATAPLGALGGWIESFLTGDDVLSRLSTVHFVLGPGLIVTLLILHFLLIRFHGASPLPWGSREQSDARHQQEGRVPYTTHLARLGAWLVALAGLVTLLAGLFPRALGPVAVEGIEVTKPPGTSCGCTPWRTPSD
ncbi:MAG: cytochrome b N-terminal domain-containing protein [Thermoleophilia bacterium]|nr:cytochrome b N-terminal domain-containing protein [Thermoleophilia bacterium]